MTRIGKNCAYTHCNAPLREGEARFEVRVAPEYADREGQSPGTYCSVDCWEAEQVRKSVEGIAKHLISDAETVLSDEGKLTG